MAQDDNEPHSARRLRMRRRHGSGAASFSGSGVSSSTRSEGLREPAPHEDDIDEVDDAIDPERVEQHVQNRAVAPRDPIDDDQSPAQVLHTASQAGSATYAKRYRMSLLHKMLLRKIPLHQIAAELGVSVSTVEKDRAELKKMLREEARQLDIDEMIGNQQGYYEEVSAMGLRIASVRDTPTAMKLAALRTSLAANADKNRFYSSAGVFDVLRFRRQEDGAAVSDIHLLLSRTENLLQSLANEDGFAAFDVHEQDSEIIDL